MPSKQVVDLVAALLVIAALIGTGWVARGWKEGSDRRSEEQAQHKAYVDRIE